MFFVVSTVRYKALLTTRKLYVMSTVIFHCLYALFMVTVKRSHLSIDTMPEQSENFHISILTRYVLQMYTLELFDEWLLIGYCWWNSVLNVLKATKVLFNTKLDRHISLRNIIDNFCIHLIHLVQSNKITNKMSDKLTYFGYGSTSLSLKWSPKYHYFVFPYICSGWPHTSFHWN